MKKRIPVLIVLLAAIGAGVFFWRRSREGVGADGILTIYGNVDIRQVELGFRVTGRLEQMRLQEGDLVAKDDLLASLDKTPYEHEVALARARVEEITANLKKLETGSRPQEIGQAEAHVAELQATLANVEREYARRKDLYEQEVIEKRAFDDIEAQRKETMARLESARQALNLARAGFRNEEIEAGRAALASAEASLDLAEVRLEDTALHAPSNGTILTRVREPGAILAAGQPVYTLALTDPVWVRAYVAEPDLGRIRPGMAAEIFTDTHPDEPIRGHIGFISPEAEFTPKFVQTEDLRTDLVYQVRVIAEDPENRLRQGMPVTVRIDTNATSASAKLRSGS